MKGLILRSADMISAEFAKTTYKKKVPRDLHLHTAGIFQSGTFEEYASAVLKTERLLYPSHTRLTKKSDIDWSDIPELDTDIRNRQVPGTGAGVSGSTNGNNNNGRRRGGPSGTGVGGTNTNLLTSSGRKNLAREAAQVFNITPTIDKT
eukprot:Nk52_evm1s1269 gene=Nk52_evmTU1s1269